MAAPTSTYKDRHFLAVIGDEVCSSPALSMLVRSSHGINLGLGDRSTVGWHWGMRRL